MLVNSQLVCFLPIWILNLVMFIYHFLFTLVLKSPNGVWPIRYTFRYTIPVLNNNKNLFLNCNSLFELSQKKKNSNNFFKYKNKKCANLQESISTMMNNEQNNKQKILLLYFYQNLMAKLNRLDHLLFTEHMKC